MIYESHYWIDDLVKIAARLYAAVKAWAVGEVIPPAMGDEFDEGYRAGYEEGMRDGRMEVTRGRRLTGVAFELRAGA